MSVYFAQVGPVVKIGYSENPERRVANLFRGGTLYSAPAIALEHRAERHLVRAIEGCKDTEAAVHGALQDFSIGLEWFVAEQPVLDFAASAATADDYEPIRREGGPVQWPHDQMAGGNHEFVMAAYLRRRARMTTTHPPAGAHAPAPHPAVAATASVGGSLGGAR